MLVKSCSKPGWLVRMAFAGRINEEFSGIHKGLVRQLEVFIAHAPFFSLTWSHPTTITTFSVC